MKIRCRCCNFVQRSGTQKNGRCQETQKSGNGGRRKNRSGQESGSCSRKSRTSSKQKIERGRWWIQVGGLSQTSGLFLWVSTCSVTRLGEILPFGYFILGIFNFFTEISSFKTWFVVLILPFKRSSKFNLSLDVWQQFGLHHQKFRDFLNLLVTLSPRLWVKSHLADRQWCSLALVWPNGERLIEQGILKGEVSLYHWPPVWLVWNQLYDNRQFSFFNCKTD
jgi:hypothetical protein